MSIKMYFNGVDLTRYIYVKSHRPLMPERENKNIKIGNSDGERYVGYRYGSNMIPVDFTFRSMTMAKERRKLAGLLHSETPVQLNFSDEPDVYVNAVIDGKPDLETDFLIGEGVLNFYVPDGVAHSRTLKTATTTTDTLDIESKGTYKSYPTFKISPKSECGFIGLVNQKGETISIGKIDELDTVNRPKSRMIIADPFDKFLWDLNKNTLGLNVHNVTASGSFRVIDGTIMPVYGAGSGYNGPVASREFSTTAKNWKLNIWHRFATSKQSHFGVFNIMITTASGDRIAGFKIDNRQVISAFQPEFILGGTDYLGYPKYGTEWGNLDATFSLKKEGSRFTFSLSRIGRNQILTKSYTREDRKDLIPGKVIMWFGQFGQGNAMTNNNIAHLTFEVTDEDNFEDIYNTFQPNDEVIVKNSSKKIYVNDILRHDLGQIGNEFFPIYPGMNTISVLKSEWADELDTELTVRELWL